MKKILLLSLFFAVLVSGCNGLPDALQGSFSTTDGSLQVNGSGNGVTVVSEKKTYQIQDVYSGFSDIYSALRQGKPGLYVTPRMMMQLAGHTVLLPPFEVHASVLLTPNLYENHPSLKDYFLVLKAQVSGVMPVPVGNMVGGSARVIYFSWDDKDQKSPEVLSAELLPNARIETADLLAAKTWGIGAGENATDLKLNRIH